MAEHGILFSAPMVRAILDGTKTVTRRVVKFREFGPSNTRGYDWTFRGTRRGSTRGSGSGCWQDYRGPEFIQNFAPGVPGENLWVRETLRRAPLPDLLAGEATEYEHAVYTADGEPCLQMEHGYDPQGFDIIPWWKGPSLPSIHLPRRASRVTLAVTSVRVERLQAITEEDARAEGVTRPDCSYLGRCNSLRCPRHCPSPYRRAFESLWDEINGKRHPWASDPWVWCISFRRLEL